MKILLAGATGLIGKELTKKLLEQGNILVVLSRSPKIDSSNLSYHLWNPSDGKLDISVFESVDAIINLAGSGVADKKWSKSYKKEILDSRILSTKLLVETLSKVQNKVKVFINASGIGYYGTDTLEAWVNEESPCGDDFLANVVKGWESEAFQAQKLGIRTIAIRTGIVLSSKGGALPKLVLPVKFWLGAVLGNGKQYLSWIDIDDLVAFNIFCLKNESANGCYNAVASQPVTNKEFNHVLARHLGKKILLPNIPAFVLKILLGEFANSLLGGNKVSNQKIKETGFEFKFETLSKSFENQNL